jgi:hypothetical protein
MSTVIKPKIANTNMTFTTIISSNLAPFKMAVCVTLARLLQLKSTPTAVKVNNNVAHLALTFSVLMLCASAGMAGTAVNKYHELKPFTSLCAPYVSAGIRFNQITQKWEASRSEVEGNLIIQKLPVSEITSDKASSCMMDSILNKEQLLGFVGPYTLGCYSIRNQGEEPLSFYARPCKENWFNGVLSNVSCSEHLPKISFLPNGHYVSHPMPLSGNPIGDRVSPFPILVNAGSCEYVSH